MKGVGLRLRTNSSKTEYFEESVEDAARSFKISGYSYQKSKEELLKFKDLDPIEIIKKEKAVKSKPELGVRSYFITNPGCHTQGNCYQEIIIIFRATQS